ncbi:macrophage migration inhibitory factor family protein [Striga asiatica]|uniref:Macrophage migration inhibitory factor family protein n=1 Tax=Striga asiatica TaxID=4170 RepID=A0A5A7RAY0_STRAF|nr:macrophage migration inhibitory factor family protein [Striga asiatica]
MPCLDISTNVDLAGVNTDSLFSDLTKAVSQIVGKPENVVMILVKGSVAITFGGNKEAAALAEIISMGGITTQVKRNLIVKIGFILEEKLSIPRTRFVLKVFAAPNAPENSSKIKMSSFVVFIHYNGYWDDNNNYIWRKGKSVRTERTLGFRRTMPCLNISTNVSLDGVDTSAVLSEASSTVAKVIGKPEAYVMVVLKGSVPIAFGGTEQPAAYGELVSIGGLTSDVNKKLSGAIASILESKLSIPKNRFYLKFYDTKVSKTPE